MIPFTLQTSKLCVLKNHYMASNVISAYVTYIFWYENIILESCDIALNWKSTKEVMIVPEGTEILWESSL